MGKTYRNKKQYFEDDYSDEYPKKKKKKVRRNRSRLVEILDKDNEFDKNRTHNRKW